MKQKLVLIIVGMPGAGKTEVSKFLEKADWNIISAGNIIREMCNLENIAPTRKNLQNYGRKILLEKGDNFFLKKLNDALDTNKNNVFEGIRPTKIINELKKNLNGKIIYIDTPNEIRLKRLEKRDGITQPQFLDIESDTLENQVSSLKPTADVIIVNDKSMSELHHKISLLLDKLQREPT